MTTPPDKNGDSDVNYDEAKVPTYDLPEALISVEGNQITDNVEWWMLRRPQIMALFANLLYGTVPTPETPIKTTYEVLKTTPDVMNGRAIRKDVRIRFENAKGTAEMVILVFTPLETTTPCPAILQLSFSNTRDDGHDVDPNRPEHLRNGVPLGAILSHGYAYVAVYQADLVHHNEVEFTSGIHPLFYRTGQSFPKASEWGVIATVAWSGSRALDYLETDSAIDASRVMIMGHSKLGKAALWAAAQDRRFAAVVSAQSGCAGAALWRRRYGETLAKMVTRFPYWLCRNAGKFINNEDDFPVDQHLLLACVAPRPVYVCSAIEDRWADPQGQYLACYHASEVYRLHGKEGFASPVSPPPGKAILQSEIGYHLRLGGHSVDRYDWEQFLAFANHHLQKPSVP